MFCKANAHGFFTVDMEPADVIWIAQITHKLGHEVFACSTRELAIETLYRWAATYWSDIKCSRPPKDFVDKQTVVSFYFGEHAEENYQINKAEMDYFEGV